MPGCVFVTFRDQITGRINDLLMDEDEASAPSQNLLGYLSGALLNFKEEGLEYAPSVVLCDSLELFLRSFPGSVAHTIGIAPLDPSSGPQILKDCGPLSSRSWSIFIERTIDEQIKYGVFTYFMLPTAITLDEGITIDPARFCLLLRKISSNTIEIKGAKGSVLTLVFSTMREAPSSVSAVNDFARACCRGLEASDEKFQMYLSHLLESSLGASHGSMLLCLENPGVSEIPELQDAVPVSPALDLHTAFLEFQETNTADSVSLFSAAKSYCTGFCVVTE